MIQYDFHKLKHEVHLVLVSVAVGTDREWLLHIYPSLKSSVWKWKGTFAYIGMPGSEFCWEHPLPASVGIQEFYQVEKQERAYC